MLAEREEYTGFFAIALALGQKSDNVLTINFLKIEGVKEIDSARSEYYAHVPLHEFAPNRACKRRLIRCEIPKLGTSSFRNRRREDASNKAIAPASCIGL